MIEPGHNHLSIQRQCHLVGLHRSSYYYQPQETDPLNLSLMRLIDELYTRYPFFGIRRITATLQRLGHQVNHKRVARLMRQMGIEAIYPKPRLSDPSHHHTKYPYLLCGLAISKPNHVWCADITYIRLQRGFVYLVAVMDWFSRYVLSWELSNSLNADFCVCALEKALVNTKPEIFNTDQGCQFTSDPFVKRLKKSAIKISMDGRGRFTDNIFIERLWRSLKYEEVYLHDYETVRACRSGISNYLSFYNNERPHQSLGYRSPSECYFESQEKGRC